MPATPQERAAALWSFAYFFMLLASYYVLRPLRDQMGIAGGVKNLPWLFTATFVTLLVAQPLYGALVAKLTRARFIPIVYHFFAANLALFWLLLTLGASRPRSSRGSSLSGSACSICSRSRCSGRSWPTCSTPSKASGCSASSAPAARRARCSVRSSRSLVSVPLGPTNLLIAAIVLLEAAVFCVYRLERAATVQAGAPTAEPPRIGGGAFAALVEMFLVALSARRRRLGQPAIVRRDHCLFRTGPHHFEHGARRRRTDAHIRQY